MSQPALPVAWAHAFLQGCLPEVGHAEAVLHMRALLAQQLLVAVHGLLQISTAQCLGQEMPNDKVEGHSLVQHLCIYM